MSLTWEEGFDTSVFRGNDNRMVPIAGSGRYKTRKIYRVRGISSGVAVRCHNNSGVNIRRALLERVYNVEREGELQPPPEPDAKALVDVRRAVMTFRRKMSHATPVNRQEFVEGYRSRKRTIYQNAADSLEHTAISRKDSYMSSFVKCEKINVTKKPDPAPRLIQPRAPRYNVEVGKYLKHIEHQVYRAIGDVMGGPTVMKGYNAAEVGSLIADAWFSFQDPIAVGLDASRFDQHVSAQILAIEHQFYLSLYDDNKDSYNELKMLLKWQMDNIGFARGEDGGFKYSVKGKRMSGDMNTALGNCLLMCGMIYAWCKSVGLQSYRLFNNGDDCVVIMERDDLGRFASGLTDRFTEWGFTMVVEQPVDQIERIEFCQSNPIHMGSGQYKMCRNPKVCMSKDCHTVLDVSNPVALQKFLGSVGNCGLALAAGVPILQEFYKCMIRSSGGGVMGQTDILESTGLYYMSRGMELKEQDVSDDARVSFWVAYGVDPTMQELLETELKQHKIAWNGVSQMMSETDQTFPDITQYESIY